jgi:hypothetical protein
MANPSEDIERDAPHGKSRSMMISVPGIDVVAALSIVVLNQTGRPAPWSGSRLAKILLASATVALKIFP